MSGWRGVREVWPAALVSGGPLRDRAVVDLEHLGPLLPDIVSLWLHRCPRGLPAIWKPRRDLPVRPTRPSRTRREAAAPAVLRAWSPFIVLTVLVGCWGIRPVKALLDRVSVAGVDAPDQRGRGQLDDGPARPVDLHVQLAVGDRDRDPVDGPRHGRLTRMAPRDAARLFGRTAQSLHGPLVTIAAVLGFAYIGNASGMMTTMGLALAETGRLFPLLSPLLGWLGVFMTGSDTSANAVFGRLQACRPNRLG